MIQHLVVLAALLGSSLSRTPSYAFMDKETVKNRCGYDACPALKDGFVNVHIVPHTHDDVGWLKTVDQYYFGSKSYIQKAGVQYILDSVIQALGKDPNRRFIYVETSYFWKWWMKQHDFVKHKVRKYVRNGQLEFIGGGWSMNDEATTHYQSIIDQFTWGLRKLNETFGECGHPRVGWQIDPFGHSREMASIVAQLGFDGLFLGRIDYQDKIYRFKTKNPEGIWLSSDNLGEKSKLFTSVLYNTYAPPSGFCFDVLCDDEPIVDDAKSPEYNVDKKVRTIREYVRNMTNVYQTRNVLITMGEDFNYQDAEMWFKNLDKLISYANGLESDDDTKYNFIYSTPSCYLKAVHDESQKKNLKWPVKTDDFFPYASDQNSYWTGYFTSRPTLKRYEREGNNFLQICKQLYALTDLGPEDWADLNKMREAMGVMQHHDAITGTEKEHVAHDYSRILSAGLAECHFVANTALSKIITNFTTVQSQAEPQPSIPMTTCPLLNITECHESETMESFIVTVYNPLSRPVTQHVRLPVTGSAYSVKDPTGTELPIQMVPIPASVLKIPGRNSTAKTELIFRASDLPPLGFKSYYIQRTKGNIVLSSINVYEHHEDLGFKVDEQTGLLSEISMNGVKLVVGQQFLYYRGTVGNNEVAKNRSSGAYIFRPNGTEAYKIAEKAQIDLYKGDLMIELHQTFNDWVSQIIRIYSNENFVEFNWLVGPIPKDDVNGKEIITRFTTELKTDQTFYTDSNGREMLKRVRDYRPTWKMEVNEPVAGNYYPVTSKILMRDVRQNIEVALLTDRAQGGSSLKDGELELMVHRNSLHDDAFGVGEALNEKAFGEGLVARGSYYLVVGPFANTSLGGKTLAAKERDLAQRKILESRFYISSTNSLPFEHYKENFTMEFSGLKKALPDNVQILTLEPWHGWTFLLRLEHVLEKDEDPILSKSATVDLKGLFEFFEIKSLKETTLGANKWLNESKRLDFVSGEDLTNQIKSDIKDLLKKQGLSDPVVNTWLEGHQRYEEDLRGENDVPKNYYEYIIDQVPSKSKDVSEYSVVLNPMEIRTFIIEVDRNQ